VIDCDFIPADYHQTSVLRRAVRTRAAMVTVLVAIMAIWMVAHHHELAKTQAMLIEATDQHAQIAAHKLKKRAMEEEQARLHEQQQLLHQLESQTRLAVVLGDISRRLPSEAVLTELSVGGAGLERFTVPLPQAQSDGGAQPPTSPATSAANGAPAASLPPESPHILLRGLAITAPDVLRFAASLEKSPLLKRVQLLSQEPAEWDGRKAERFEITCDLRQQEASVP